MTVLNFRKIVGYFRAVPVRRGPEAAPAVPDHAASFPLLAAARNGDVTGLSSLSTYLSNCTAKDVGEMRSLLNPLGRAGLSGFQTLVWARLLEVDPDAREGVQRALRISIAALGEREDAEVDPKALGSAIETIADCAFAAPNLADLAWINQMIQLASGLDPLARSKRSAALVALLAPEVAAKALLRLQSSWPALNAKWIWAFYAETRRIGRLKEAELLIASLSSGHPMQGRYFFGLVHAKARRRAYAEVFRDLASKQGGLLSVKEVATLLKAVPPATPVVAFRSGELTVSHALKLFMGCAHDGRHEKLRALVADALRGYSPAAVAHAGVKTFREDSAKSAGIDWREIFLSLEAVHSGLGGVLAKWVADSVSWKRRASAAQALLRWVEAKWESDGEAIEKLRASLSLLGAYPVGDLDGPSAPVRSVRGENSLQRVQILLTFCELDAEVAAALVDGGAIFEELRVGLVTAKERGEGAPETVSDVGFSVNTVEDYASAELSYRMSQYLSEAICGAANSRGIREKEVVRLLIEDRIFPSVSQSKKLVSYLNDKNSPNVGIVVDSVHYVSALQTAAFLRLSGLNNLTVIFCASGHSLNVIQDAWSDSSGGLKDKVLDMASAPIKDVKPSALNLSKWLPRLVPRGEKAVNPGRTPNVLIATSLGDGSYFTSAVALVKSISGFCKLKLYNGAASGGDRFLVASGLSGVDLIARASADPEIEAAMRPSAKRMFDMVKSNWAGGENDLYFLANASRFLKSIPLGVAHEICQAKSIRRIISDQEIDLLVTMPGRMVCARSASIDARSAHIPVLDLQAFFISAHPRYHAGIADVYAGLTEDQLDIYRSKKPPKRQRLARIGSLMIGEQLARVRDMSVDDARASCSVPAGRPMVVFGAQHGQGAEGEEIIKMVVRATGAIPNSLLVVKLHPRTPLEGVEAIRSLVEQEVGGEVRVEREGDIYALMRAADLVVTQFSNVGLEAAMMGRPVISVNLTGSDYVVDLARLGVAVRAVSEDDLTQKVRSLLGDEEARAVLTRSREAYLDRNPELRDLSASAEVAKLVRELVGIA